MEPLLYCLLALSVLSAALSLLSVLTARSGRRDSERELRRQLDQLESELAGELRRRESSIANELRQTRQESTILIQNAVGGLGNRLSDSQKQAAELQSSSLGQLARQMMGQQENLQKQLEERLRTLSAQSEYQMKETRETVERRLNAIQKDNSDQLSRIRETVDEKLQKTLEERLGQSFKQVSDQLQQVYKGLGEMQTLATGVGDLKKVLSNVKTRGILGEIQLGAILEQILAPEQYSTNVATRPGSRDVVEYAVRLPGSEEGGVVWLPIDAKFPGDLYGQLMDAYDQGDKEVIQGLQKQLEQRIKAEARDIRDKYIEPPYTTEFGILFLPVEGLYAEVVRLGLVETLQRDYKINIAGPTTMAALLNSLQMGFRTLAIQKRSSEVWNVLGAVKSEFQKFGDVLKKTRDRLRQADDELETLVGTRTNQINRRLREVSSLSEDNAQALLGE